MASSDSSTDHDFGVDLLEHYGDEPIVLSEPHCRAISDGRVCGVLAKQCTRKGHKDIETPRGDVGAYASLGLLNKKSTVPDGDLDNFVPMADYLQDLETRATQQQAESEDVANTPMAKLAAGRSPFVDVKPENDPDEGIPTELKSFTATLLGAAGASLKSALETPGAKSVKAAFQRRTAGQKLEKDMAKKLAAAQAEFKKAQASRDARALEDAHKAKALEVEEEAAAIEGRIQQMRKELETLMAVQVKMAAGPGPAGPTPAGPATGTLPHGAPTVHFAPPVPDSSARTAHPAVVTPARSTDHGAPRGTTFRQIPSGQDTDHDPATIHGTSTVLDEVLFQSLLPKEMPTVAAGELQHMLPDIVSPLVGTFNNAGTPGREEEADGILNALQQHTNAVHKQKGGFVKQDSSWASPNRVGLYKVKSAADLTRLLYSHNRRDKKFAQTLTSRVRSVLHHYGVDPIDAEEFAQSSRYINLCLRMHDLYGRLLQYLDVEVQRCGYKYMKPVIDLIAMDLVGFRDDVSRVGMWFNTYLYIRTLYQNRWWSPEIQLILNQTLQESRADDTPGLCPWCRGHIGEFCPFESANVPSAAAVDLANQAKRAGGKFTKACKTVIATYKTNNPG